MSIAAIIFLLFAAILHIYIFILETFLWDKPQGMKTFSLDHEFAHDTLELAANQGLYNLLLAIEMIVAVFGVANLELWGVVLGIAGAGSTVIAGTYLFITSPNKRKPALIQLTPGLVATILLVIMLLTC